MDDGARLLPSALFIDYANRIRDLKAEFHHAADEFASEFPAYVEDSKVRLGRLFSVADYPDPNDIRSLFAFDSKILPCPDADDFRIDIEEHAADIRADVEARFRQALDDAMREDFPPSCVKRLILGRAPLFGRHHPPIALAEARKDGRSRRHVLRAAPRRQRISRRQSASTPAAPML